MMTRSCGDQGGLSCAPMPGGLTLRTCPASDSCCTFPAVQHPDTILRNPPRHPMEEDHDWQPFDFVLHKYLHGWVPGSCVLLRLCQRRGAAGTGRV